MPQQNLALVLLSILIPQLGSLTIKWTRTVSPSILLTLYEGLTHLFGSSSKLCRLNSTLLTSYPALHLSFSKSRQILPAMSMLG